MFRDQVAFVCGTAASARDMQKRLYETSDEYREGSLYIGFVLQRWEGFRFKMIVISSEARLFMEFKMRTEDKEEVIEALTRRLDRGGQIIWQEL
jgi:hypothetical protein